MLPINLLHNCNNPIFSARSYFSHSYQHVTVTNNHSSCTKAAALLLLASSKQNEGGLGARVPQKLSPPTLSLHGVTHVLYGCGKGLEVGPAINTHPLRIAQCISIMISGNWRFMISVTQSILYCCLIAHNTVWLYM